MRKIDKNIELSIIDKYLNGSSMKNIGIEFNTNPATVFNILKRNNIQTRTKGGIYKLDECEIIDLYKSGMSTTNISEKYNVNNHTIINILEKHKIPRNNIYHNLFLKNNYWEIIDSNDKAYFLGFLITDGNITGNAIRLSLNIKDIEILNIFSRVTNNGNKIYKDKRNCAIFGVKRRKWVDDLSKYGVIPNKTSSVYLPLIKNDLMSHLIRGIIDGDGWITKRGQIGLCGNYQLVSQVKDYLVDTLNVYNVKIIQCKTPTLYMIAWSNKKDFKIICDFIYNNKEDFYLKRKFNNYQFVIHDNTEVISEIAQGSGTP